MIEPENSESSPLSDLDFRSKFHAKLSSNDPWSRIAALGKINSVLKEYEHPERRLDELDK